jgi:hypothetical protein
VNVSIASRRSSLTLWRLPIRRALAVVEEIVELAGGSALLNHRGGVVHNAFILTVNTFRTGNRTLDKPQFGPLSKNHDSTSPTVRCTPTPCTCGSAARPDHSRVRSRSDQHCRRMIREDTRRNTPPTSSQIGFTCGRVVGAPTAGRMRMQPTDVSDGEARCLALQNLQPPCWLRGRSELTCPTFSRRRL